MFNNDQDAPEQTQDGAGDVNGNSADNSGGVQAGTQAGGSTNEGVSHVLNIGTFVSGVDGESVQLVDPLGDVPVTVVGVVVGHLADGKAIVGKFATFAVVDENELVTATGEPTPAS